MARYSYFVSEPVETVRDRLASETGSWISVKRFCGEVSDDGFRLSPNNMYRNSLVPVAVGQFVPQSDGTKIVVTTQNSFLTILAGIVWHVIGAAIALSSLSTKIGEDAWQTCAFGVGAIVLFGILLFGAALTGDMEYKKAFNEVFA